MDSLLQTLRHPKAPEPSGRFYAHLLKAELNALLDSDIFTEVLVIEEFHTTASNEELLHLAIGSLIAFLQFNFLGPRDKTQQSDPTSLENTRAQLKSDGEELNVNVVRADCLLVCKKIFERLINHDAESNASAGSQLCLRLWYQRYLLVHQRCIDDLTHELYERFNGNVAALEATLTDADRSLKVEICLEILLGYIQFKRITKSEQWLSKLESSSNVALSVEGALGVRTKFQQNPLPQLILRLQGVDDLELPDACETHGNFKLPSILKLEDEVRLEKVKFLNEQENEDLQLPALVQNMVLGKLYFLYVSQPKEQLTLEEIQPYITSLVYQRFGPWETRVAALFLNATIEATHKRTVDRSLRQIEELIQQFATAPSDESASIPIEHRLPMVFSSWLISYWQMKEKLADVMVSLGMVKGALDIYQAVQSWENVIDCYTVLEMRHLAAAVIRELIERNGPTVRLYCMLGDATDDVDCYQQAWNLSKETSASAQRHWGNYYFARKDYTSAIEHLRRSIEINCLQERTLLRLGYSALQLERWEEAAYAYRLYTSFESHGFEPWNNLAKAYIMLGEKPRAHKVLQEALKCNFSNWKVWENYLLVCIDTRNFADALNAYERLLELKDRYYDKQVLEIIVRAIVLGESDADGTSCSRLKKKAISMLGHACAQQPNNGYLYELAAELEDTDLLRCQKLQNAYRGYTQSNSQWAKVSESCSTVVNLCVELCERSLKAFVDGKKEEERFVALRSQLSSARLTGQACLRSASSEAWPLCVEPLGVLQTLVDNITTELKQAMGQ
ncbi:tetratricopeptide repeat protein 27 [Anopheles maculipalpis]|uniref:tetratricopeptide repeat protein 27 n=1 Tax=Anopheles maculipalpis TaxID=1496333 RepID=UPI0021593056|nr:tetratricopeptide repeat protein 27 [Anopheles maculipalpis]